jgi:hypothetical protein
MRSAVQQASAGVGQANASANQYNEQGNQINSTLLPGLEREANSPQGYTPEEMNDQLVASEQGAGGATAGITGQANLQAARTRNSAGETAALDSAARTKQQTLSENALNIKNKSANLGQQKQMNAQSELEKMYGIDTSANLEAQGLIPKDVDAEAQANSTGWMQNMDSTITAISKLIGAGAGA